MSILLKILRDEYIESLEENISRFKQKGFSKDEIHEMLFAVKSPTPMKELLVELQGERLAPEFVEEMEVDIEPFDRFRESYTKLYNQWKKNDGEIKDLRTSLDGLEDEEEIKEVESKLKVAEEANKKNKEALDKFYEGASNFIIQVLEANLEQAKEKKIISKPKKEVKPAQIPKIEKGSVARYIYFTDEIEEIFSIFENKDWKDQLKDSNVKHELQKLFEMKGEVVEFFTEDVEEPYKDMRFGTKRTFMDKFIRIAKLAPTEIKEKLLTYVRTDKELGSDKIKPPTEFKVRRETINKYKEMVKVMLKVDKAVKAHDRKYRELKGKDIENKQKRLFEYTEAQLTELLDKLIGDNPNGNIAILKGIKDHFGKGYEWDYIKNKKAWRPFTSKEDVTLDQMPHIRYNKDYQFFDDLTELLMELHDLLNDHWDKLMQIHNKGKLKITPRDFMQRLKDYRSKKPKGIREDKSDEEKLIAFDKVMLEQSKNRIKQIELALEDANEKDSKRLKLILDDEKERLSRLKQKAGKEE